MAKSAAPYHGRRVSACCMLIWRGCVLLGWHTKRQGWELPGGAQGTGETIRGTILREITEETGLSITDEQLRFLTFMEHDGPTAAWMAMIFSAQLPDSTIAPEAAGRDDAHPGGFLWFPLHALPRDLTPWARLVLCDFAAPFVHQYCLLAPAVSEPENKQAFVPSVPGGCRADTLGDGERFRRCQGEHIYVRISPSGLRQIGKQFSAWKVYGVDLHNGNVTVLRPDDEVVRITEPC